MSQLNITLIQTSLHWEDKAANLQMLEAKIRSISTPTHIVVLPEMFSTGFSMKPETLAETMDGPTVQWMKRLAAEKRFIITGSIMVEEEGRYYNRLIWMLPNGQMGCYDKRHLFAMGEEDEHYSSGGQRFIASVNGWKINCNICYDLRFPVWARQQYTQAEGFEYDVLLYVANWPERRSLAWNTLLQARAIENQAYCIGINRVGEDGAGIAYNGNTAAFGPLGEALLAPVQAPGVYTVTLEKEPLAAAREQFSFLKDADKFLLL